MKATDETGFLTGVFLRSGRNKGAPNLEEQLHEHNASDLNPS